MGQKNIHKMCFEVFVIFKILQDEGRKRETEKDKKIQKKTQTDR